MYEDKETLKSIEFGVQKSSHHKSATFNFSAVAFVEAVP